MDLKVRRFNLANRTRVSMKSVLTVTVLSLAFVVAQAQTSTGQFALSGAGTSSCGKYIAASSKEDVVLFYISWVQGFLSGMNIGYARGAKLEFIVLPDSDTIKLYLDRYCRDNPLKTPLDGALDLYDKIRK